MLLGRLPLQRQPEHREPEPQLELQHAEQPRLRQRHPVATRRQRLGEDADQPRADQLGHEQLPDLPEPEAGTGGRQQQQPGGRGGRRVLPRGRHQPAQELGLVRVRAERGLLQAAVDRHTRDGQEDHRRPDPAQNVLQLGGRERQAGARVRGRHPDRAQGHRQAEGLEGAQDEADIWRPPSLQPALSAADLVHDGLLAFNGTVLV